MTELDLLTTPGHDRDVAYAMLSQSRLRHGSPIDDIQVRHLLAIGYRAGQAAERDRLTVCRCGRTHCPCCGSHRDLGRFDVCVPCAANMGWDPQCPACLLDQKGEDAAGVAHGGTCGGGS